MAERTDIELVDLARGGDVGAAGDLFSRYWRAARGAAFGVTGDFASAEDAAAEAFRQALGGLKSLRDSGRFGAWLRTTVVRQAQAAMKDCRRYAGADESEPADSGEQPEDMIARFELSAVVQRAVRDLPGPLREAVALFYFEGYETDAAARFLDIPAGTFRRRLHDARERLRVEIEQILSGGRPMDERSHQQIERLKGMMRNGEIYQAMRESLALRPPPDLIRQIVRGLPLKESSFADVARVLLGPSDRANDPSHPVGAVAAAIRQALPEFLQWEPDPGKTAARLSSGRVDLPPGFSDGRPGRFIRSTRALVRAGAPVKSIYEHLQQSPDEHAFAVAKPDMRMSDVLDLTWMSPGAIELREVQETLERLTAAVLPGVTAKFSSYDEPRYRVALEVQLGDPGARAAIGGPLREWPGRPSGVDAALVRIYLEPWASLRSGRPVELARVPAIRPEE